MSNYTQKIVTSLMKYEPVFNRVYSELNRSQYYQLDEIGRINDLKLKRLITHCYRHVPYYTDLFASLGIIPEDIKTAKDLGKLPFLEKNIIRANLDKFISKKLSSIFRTAASTSGTTGTPSVFYRDYRSIVFENAVLHRFRKTFDCDNTRMIKLREDIVAPMERKHPPFWKYYPVNQELVMSSYHLNEYNFEAYREKIRAYRPEIIYAYPSAVFQLARLFHNAGDELRLKAVFTSSETLSPRNRSFIEQTFKCSIHDWYGQVERVAAISQCESGTYHIQEDYSIVETVMTDLGCEIIGTGLNNYVMPLIRYRTFDIVELDDNECACGRHFRCIKNIFGRSVNFITTPEGNKISFFLVSDSVNREDNVEEVQFIHPAKGELIVNVVKNSKFNEKNTRGIIRNIKERTSPAMRVKIIEVDRIPKGAGGKVSDIVVGSNTAYESEENRHTV